MTQSKDDKQQKAYKIRLYPNQKQQTLINQTFGCVRWTYNHFLTVRMDTYEQEKRTIGYQACSKQLTTIKEQTDWLRIVDKFALQNSIRDLDVAYKKFFAKPVKSFNPKRVAKAKRKGRNLTAMDLDGYPKYKFN